MKNKYFIRTKGKSEFKTYHLICLENFDMLDIFFDSELEATEYAAKNLITIIDYIDAFEAVENDKE